MDQKDWKDLTIEEKVADLRKDILRLFDEINRLRQMDSALEGGISEVHRKIDDLASKASSAPRA
ncbi:hypothetical protein V5F79_23620 [Xanthobacter flavus]|uniref:hypothetical protein n=1 Tax=Xanthobacter flavus TaxID=281 RepID=UPI0037269F0F